MVVKTRRRGLQRFEKPLEELLTKPVIGRIMERSFYPSRYDRRNVSIMNEENAGKRGKERRTGKEAACNAICRRKLRLLSS